MKSCNKQEDHNHRGGDYAADVLVADVPEGAVGFVKEDVTAINNINEEKKARETDHAGNGRMADLAKKDDQGKPKQGERQNES